jgi:hypothetical protein
MTAGLSEGRGKDEGRGTEEGSPDAAPATRQAKRGSCTGAVLTLAPGSWCRRLCITAPSNQITETSCKIDSRLKLILLYETLNRE